MSDKTRQKEVNSVLIKIKKIVAGDGDYIFRGEAEDYGTVSSTLYRTYTGMRSAIERTRGRECRLTMADMQEQTITDAKEYATEKDDDAILELVQHYGGDTNLIDFSHDYLIALFFACDGHHDRDGRLIVYDKNAIDAEVTLVAPRELRGRIMAQKSIFVAPKSGVLEVKQENIIPIPAPFKQPILNFLRAHHNITERTIYNDIHGYIRQKKIHREADRHLYRTYCYIEDSVEQDTLMAYKKGREDNESTSMHEKKKKKAYEHAIAEYKKAIEINPRFAAAYSNRGDAYCQLHKYKQAIADYTTAIELAPQYAEAYCGRGVVYGRLHEHRDAIADFTMAIELAPQMTDAYSNRGVAYYQLHEHEKAIADFTTALGLEPQFAEAYCERGVVYDRLHKHEKAIANFTLAIELAPQCAIAYYSRGLSYGKRHEYENAIADYTMAIELAPHMTDAYCNRGVSYGKLHEHKHAIADFTTAIEIAPKMTDAYYNRGVVYGKLHTHNKAIKDFTAAIELAPQCVDAYCNRGIAYEKLYEYRNAITNYTAAIRINPQMTDAYRNRALCYDTLALEEQNEEKRHILYTRALEDHYAILEHNPNDSEGYLRLFSFYQRLCTLEGERGDAEEKRVREGLKHIVNRTLQLVDEQEDGELYAKVQEAFDELRA